MSYIPIYIFIVIIYWLIDWKLSNIKEKQEEIEAKLNEIKELELYGK